MAPIAAVEREFHLYTLKAEALWGTEVGKVTDELLRCIRNLAKGIYQHVQITAPGRNTYDPDHIREVGNIVWKIRGARNVFTNEINAAIQQIEDIVRPHLKQK